MLAHSHREQIDKRNVITNYQYLWNYGVIYFEIDGRTTGKSLLRNVAELPTTAIIHTGFIMPC